MKALIFFIMASGFLVSGCESFEKNLWLAPTTIASGWEVKNFNVQFSPQKHQIVKLPTLNSEHVSEIGESMIFSYMEKEFSTITLQEPLSVLRATRSDNSTEAVMFKNSPSSYEKYGHDNNGSFYIKKITPTPDILSQNYFLLENGNIKQAININSGIYIPNNKDESAGVFIQATDAKEKMLFYPTPSLKYKTDDKFISAGYYGTKRELIYNGISGRVVNITYREFTGDGTARPAFTQDLKYDLTQGDIVGFKGARFKITKADNLKITFTVLKHIE